MPKNNVRITVLGKCQKKLLAKYSSIFDIDSNASKTHLFCDYSEFDIPIDYAFSMVLDIDGKILYTGNIILSRVSQQYFEPLDSIPNGWQTICEFEGDKQFLLIVGRLPELEGWARPGKSLVLT